MTTATNIQMADNGTTGTIANSKEMAMMKVRSNIQGIIQGNARVIAGIVAGAIIAAAFIFPGNAFADSPARPVGEAESASFIISANVNFTEVDEWVSLTYQPKLARSNAAAPEVDEWVSLTYQPKLARSNTAAPEVDEWVSLTYNEKLAVSFDYPESLILNDNFYMDY